MCVCRRSLVIDALSFPLSLSLSLTSLRRDHFLLRSWPWKGLLNTCLRFKNVLHVDFLELHGKKEKRFKRLIKTKNCVLNGCKIWKKWFGRWDATYFFHDASLDSFVNEALLQRQCIMTWDKCRGSRFTHYTTHVAPNHIFVEWGNSIHRYMLEPISFSVIRTIASMRLSSHALRCETGLWGTSDESGRLCTLCSKKVKSLSIIL